MGGSRRLNKETSLTMQRFVSRSAAETMECGRHLGEQLPQNAVVCFFGDLAAGKTTFIKGFASGAAQVNPEHVHSPTFTYLHIYPGSKTIYHFDLYRLRDLDEFLSMGFDEYFEAGGICCIEWSERIDGYLPQNYVRVHLEHGKEDERYITIDWKR
jgi:tRNA threonylcarbamoyladenosine biosynthesis protein TsaE